VYGTPIVALGSEVVVMTGPLATMAMLSGAIAVLDRESVTWTVNDDVPAPVGVPVILLFPVPLRDNPEGSDPDEIDHV
jgi:hypothetical protein